MAYLLVYLAGVVAANLLVARYGPDIVSAVGFFLIGLDLVVRDVLHTQWASDGMGVWRRMGLLVLTGTAITGLMNVHATQVAVASALAFSAAFMLDGLVYTKLRRHSWMGRSVGSNAPSALVDSIIFPTIAFAEFMPMVVLTTALVKFGGGVLWALLLNSRMSQLDERG